MLDGHNDLPWALREYFESDLGRADLAAGSGLHTDLPRLRAGGVGAQFWSVYVPHSLAGEAAVAALSSRSTSSTGSPSGTRTTWRSRSTPPTSAVLAAGRIASLIGAEGGHRSTPR